MAKYKFRVSTGIVGSDRAEIIDIPDELLEGKSEAEQHTVVDEFYENWLWDGILDGGFEKVEGEE